MRPQQTSEKSSPTEQACPDPASMDDAVKPSGRSTNTAYSLSAPATLFPSCPSELSPQQATLPSDNNAHPNFSPKAKTSDSPIEGFPLTAPSIISHR